MIWIIDFLDFIFAEENLKKEFRIIIIMISIYNTIQKMNFDKNTYNTEILNPSFYLGHLAIQVHEYRQ